MKCPKCGSENVSVYLEKKRSGLVDLIAIIFLLCIPVIGWAVLIFNSPSQEHKTGVCQNCANSFEIKTKKKPSRMGIILLIAFVGFAAVTMIMADMRMKMGGY